MKFIVATNYNASTFWLLKFKHFNKKLDTRNNFFHLYPRELPALLATNLEGKTEVKIIDEDDDLFKYSPLNLNHKMVPKESCMYNRLEGVEYTKNCTSKMPLSYLETFYAKNDEEAILYFKMKYE